MFLPLQRRHFVIALTTIAVICVPVRLGRDEGVQAALPTEWELFYEPTPPAPLQRVLTESAPTAALAVALPGAQVLGNTPKEAFFARLIEIAAGYVNVVILVNRDESLAILKIRELIRRHVKNAERVLARITFVRANIDTEWIRDYGPVFALGVGDDLVLLDNMYRDIRGEAQTERTLLALGFVKTDEVPTAARDNSSPKSSGNGPYLSDYGHFWRRNDDAAPLYFNEFLYLQRHRFARLVRTPLQLSGGDLLFVFLWRLALVVFVSPWFSRCT